jgi:cardiolipin synthase
MAKYFFRPSLVAFLILSGCAGHVTNRNPAQVVGGGTVTNSSAPNPTAAAGDDDATTDITFFNTPNNFKAGDVPNEFVDWLTMIGQAQQSITMEMFHLTNAAVVSALELKPTTVQITLILDGKNLLAPATKAIADDLASHPNIKVIPSSKEFNETHTKAMIIDYGTPQAAALITSMNLTDNATVQRDYGVRTENIAIIGEMNEVFQADLSNAAHSTKLTPADAGQGDLIWSPINSESRIASLIKESESITDLTQKYVEITVENLGDDAIQGAMVHAAAAGVTVKLLVPECAMGVGNRNYLFFDALTGVQTQVMPHPSSSAAPYMHGKMVILGNGRGYLGSVNYSLNSTQKNRELGIVFTNSEVTKQMHLEFMQDWNNSVTIPSTLVTPTAPNTNTAPYCPKFTANPTI